MNTPTAVRQQEGMYGMAMPDLIPPTGALQPSPVIQCERTRAEPRGTRRAPKLGQIGRSTRVVIDDEDLDDIINNNRSFRRLREYHLLPDRLCQS